MVEDIPLGFGDDRLGDLSTSQPGTELHQALCCGGDGDILKGARTFLGLTHQGLELAPTNRAGTTPAPMISKMGLLLLYEDRQQLVKTPELTIPEIGLIHPHITPLRAGLL
jgi:hypothetical protein